VHPALSPKVTVRPRGARTRRRNRAVGPPSASRSRVPPADNDISAAASTSGLMRREDGVDLAGGMVLVPWPSNSKSGSANVTEGFRSTSEKLPHCVRPSGKARRCRARDLARAIKGLTLDGDAEAEARTFR